jgi:hypothetical protein
MTYTELIRHAEELFPLVNVTVKLPPLSQCVTGQDVVIDDGTFETWLYSYESAAEELTAIANERL